MRSMSCRAVSCKIHGVCKGHSAILRHSDDTRFIHTTVRFQCPLESALTGPWEHPRPQHSWSRLGHSAWVCILQIALWRKGLIDVLEELYSCVLLAEKSVSNLIVCMDLNQIQDLILARKVLLKIHLERAVLIADLLPRCVISIYFLPVKHISSSTMNSQASVRKCQLQLSALKLEYTKVGQDSTTHWRSCDMASKLLKSSGMGRPSLSWAFPAHHLQTFFSTSCTPEIAKRGCLSRNLN